MKINLLISSIFTLIILALAGWLWQGSDESSRYDLLTSVRIPERVIAKVFSNNAEIQYLLGNRHLGGEGKYDLVLAEKYYDRAVVLDDNLPYLHYQRARVYFLTMRYRKAIEEVDKEIGRDPNFSRSYYLRGLVYGYDRRFSEAARDFEEFTRRQPDEWAGYNDLAWVLFQVGDYAGVKRVMEEVLSQQKNAWLLNAYGVALLNLEELEGAKKALLEARLFADRMDAEDWGLAYIGNNPLMYDVGLEDMRKNIEGNLKLVEKRLLESV